jgi:hypothetical protein
MWSVVVRFKCSEPGQQRLQQWMPDLGGMAMGLNDWIGTRCRHQPCSLAANQTFRFHPCRLSWHTKNSEQTARPTMSTPLVQRWEQWSAGPFGQLAGLSWVKLPDTQPFWAGPGREAGRNIPSRPSSLCYIAHCTVICGYSMQAL